MKKFEIHIYKVTPEEMLKLPAGTQVLCCDANSRRCDVKTITPKDKQAESVLKESVCDMLDIHFFIFELPKGYKGGEE